MAVTGADVVEWDRIAVREAVRVVDLARDEDWSGRPRVRGGT